MSIEIHPQNSKGRLLLVRWYFGLSEDNWPFKLELSVVIETTSSTIWILKVQDFEIF